MPRVIALIGPTAVGKTAISIELAHALDAEIVSCDSMQVYRHMHVLSQAPTHAQRSQVQHHLFDCIEPSQSFSVGQFRRMAASIINRILERGKRVLIVGGTGLYLKALTEGLCDAPPADTRIREQLWSECNGRGSRRLYDRLTGVDSIAASRIHPNDARRIIRALEVYTLTGKPISSWWREASAELLQGQIHVIGLDRVREELYNRINRRVLDMIYEEGVISEVRQLVQMTLSRTARQVHGLGDILRYLSGSISLKDSIGVWQQRVRNYAKRQNIWFRQIPGIQWVNVGSEQPPWESAEHILNLLRQRKKTPVAA